jgi:MFS family permease
MAPSRQSTAIIPAIFTLRLTGSIHFQGSLLSTSSHASNHPSPTRASLVPLLVIATTQLMVVLDDSIVNIALPSIQSELGVTPTLLPWVINAYILTFGALLLIGGRIGDLKGRKRTLQVGIAIFILASLIGGLGLNVEMLIAARAVQGLGAALAAPNALALIATTFPERTMRDKALALYGAMSGIGIIIGLLLGGLLTDLLDWRWVFFINIPIGLLVLLGTRTLIAAERRTGRLNTLSQFSAPSACSPSSMRSRASARTASQTLSPTPSSACPRYC